MDLNAPQPHSKWEASKYDLLIYIWTFYTFPIICFYPHLHMQWWVGKHDFSLHILTFHSIGRKNYICELITHPHFMTARGSIVEGASQSPFCRRSKGLCKALRNSLHEALSKELCKVFFFPLGVSGAFWEASRVLMKPLSVKLQEVPCNP